MTDLAVVAPYDLPFEGVEVAVFAWVKEALELRHGTANDPKGKLNLGQLQLSSYPDVLEALERVVLRADRVDELLANATQARGRARRAMDQASFSAELAKDEAARAGLSKRVEFSARFEREADANLDSLEERRVAHHAARLVSVTQESYDVIYQVHRQLTEMRQDLRSILRTLQFESSLEH